MCEQTLQTAACQVLIAKVISTDIAAILYVVQVSKKKKFSSQHGSYNSKFQIRRRNVPESHEGRVTSQVWFVFGYYRYFAPTARYTLNIFSLCHNSVKFEAINFSENILLLFFITCLCFA